MKPKITAAMVTKLKKEILTVFHDLITLGEDPVVSVDYRKKYNAVTVSAMEELVKEGKVSQMDTRTDNTKKYYKYIGKEAA